MEKGSSNQIFKQKKPTSLISIVSEKSASIIIVRISDNSIKRFIINFSVNDKGVFNIAVIYSCKFLMSVALFKIVTSYCINTVP